MTAYLVWAADSDPEKDAGRVEAYDASFAAKSVASIIYGSDPFRHIDLMVRWAGTPDAKPERYRVHAVPSVDFCAEPIEGEDGHE